MMKIRGKKALGEMMLEIAFAIILMVIVFIALLYISYNQTLKVYATVEADKSEFACKNQLLSIMNFRYNNIQNYKDKLIESYMKADYSGFEKKLNQAMDEFLKQNSWNVKVDDGTTTEIFGREELELRIFQKITSCSIFVAVPCTESCGTCLLNVSLESKYEK